MLATVYKFLVGMVGHAEILPRATNTAVPRYMPAGTASKACQKIFLVLLSNITISKYQNSNMAD